MRGAVHDAVTDPWQLQRFVDAQAPVFEQVCRELDAGCKQSHWMWFVFPQLKGLGHSAVANHFGIGSLAEASAYLQHPLLGPRLRDCTQRVLATRHRTVSDMFAHPDDLKFHSSMTLFAHVDRQDGVFAAALRRFFAGEPDRATQALMQHRVQ